MKKMVLDSSAWDSLCISLTLLTKRAECCVLGTPTSPEPPYLILSTSPVLTTGDTSFTTTTELILRILRGIPFMLVMIYVKLKFMVRVLDFLINTLGNKRFPIRLKKNVEHISDISFQMLSFFLYTVNVTYIR